MAPGGCRGAAAGRLALAAAGGTATGAGAYGRCWSRGGWLGRGGSVFAWVLGGQCVCFPLGLKQEVRRNRAIKKTLKVLMLQQPRPRTCFHRGCRARRKSSSVRGRRWKHSKPWPTNGSSRGWDCLEQWLGGRMFFLSNTIWGYPG